MPQYISKEGTWHPAKERIALKNLSGKVKKDHKGEDVQPGDDYIYEGPDRAALFELWKEKVETLGQDFRTDPQFLQAVRNQGFNTVDEYLKAIGYDQEKALKDFREKASVIHKGELPKKVEAIRPEGGGTDTTGTQKTRYGGFGSQPEG